MSKIHESVTDNPAHDTVPKTGEQILHIRMLL
jgi:hypothetical protein